MGDKQIVDVNNLKLPQLPRPYYWQRSYLGASLIKDRRTHGERRTYLGHYPDAALRIVFEGRSIEDFDLSIKKRIRIEQSVERLRREMAKIEE